MPKNQLKIVNGPLLKNQLKIMDGPASAVHFARASYRGVGFSGFSGRWAFSVRFLVFLVSGLDRPGS